MSLTQTDRPSTEAMMNSAVAQHRSGNVAEAERLYCGILAMRPDHADAHHNLGVLKIQTGQPALALGHFQAALEADPRQPGSWLNCIDVLTRLGQTGPAQEMLAHARQCGLADAAAEAVASQLRALSKGGAVRPGIGWMPDLSGDPYTSVLTRLHVALRPRTYLEIGVETGATLALSECASIGIDPCFQFGDTGLIQRIVAKPSLLLYQMPSDEFFGRFDPTLMLGAPIDFVFLDGMHRCEYLLRDFLNVERHCHAGSVVALHDCLPLEAPMAEREPHAADYTPSRQSLWTGDIWRTALLLKRRRRDLRMVVLDAVPTGLVLITNLDPRSKVLSCDPETVAEMMSWKIEDLTLSGYYKEIGVEAELRVRRPEDLLARLSGDSSSPQADKKPEADRGSAVVASVPFISAPIASTPLSAAAQHWESSKVAKKIRKQGRRATARNARSKLLPDGPALPASGAKQEAVDEAMLMGLYRQHRFAEVEAAARALAEQFPSRGFLWKVMGAAVQQQKRFEEALEIKLRATELLPGDAEMQNNLGNALLKLSRYDEAEVCYRRATTWRPDYPEAWSGLGLAAQKLGRLEEAERFCRHALSLRPVFADGSCNLGITLQFLDRLEEAEACYRAALEAEPTHIHALSNLGSLLQKKGRPDAEEFYSRALALDPDFVDALVNLASCVFQDGRIEEAIAAHRRAIEADPTSTQPYSNLLFCLSHRVGTTPEDLFAEQLRFAERFEAPLVAQWRPHTNSRDPYRPLHVGFVSADFYRHAMASFIEPMLSHLGRDRSLVLHAYNYRSLEDEATVRMRAQVQYWNCSVGVLPEALAAQVRADGIDILFDLCGHTGGGSPLAFARKPAPIQIGWIGYLGSSGMKCMDYYLADPLFLPPGEFDRFFTETIVRLPAVSAFEPPRGAPEVSRLPALASGRLTFGSFSRPGKLNPEVIALWSQLLRALPDSRMVLGAMPSDSGHDLLDRWFTNEGIEADRLEFHPNSGIGSYFDLHRRIDICLDPFPFTGATTTGNAMWMGVPTLTLEGNTPAGKLGAAMLRHAGLEDFVVRDHDDFVARGVRWAGNLERLSELRAGMRARVLASPLGQPEVFARELSGLLRKLWQDWCSAAS